MKKLIYGGLFLSSVGIGFVGCDKVNFEEKVIKEKRLLVSLKQRVRMNFMLTSLIHKVNRIKKYEDNCNYGKLNENESRILQLFSSLARYSIYYWASIKQGELGKYDYFQRNFITNKADDDGDYWRKIALNDFYSSCFSAFFTANPLVAIGGGIAGSEIGVGLNYSM